MLLFAGFGSARALRLTMQAAQPPEEWQPGDFAERAMKDINRVGPSDARRKAIEDKMRQLREQGKVASNSIMTDSMAELGVSPALPPPASPPPAPSPPPLDAPPGRTSGIGGAWTPEAAKEGERGYKPKVGTWGVFERPADISKAYGGGKRVGLGGYQEDEETRAKKRAETEELLRQYRRSRGMDLTLELEHADEIAAAQEEARQLMRFGDRRGAISQLEAVTEWCTSNTPLGGSTLLELAIALDADGRRDEARKLFVKLQSSEHKNTRKVAQQMLFQEEAAEFLKVDASGAGSEAEYAKLATPTLMAARQFRTYSTTDGTSPLRRDPVSEPSRNLLGTRSEGRVLGFLTSARRPPVESISEARMVLRTAAVRRDAGGAPPAGRPVARDCPRLPEVGRDCRHARAGRPVARVPAHAAARGVRARPRRRGAPLAARRVAARPHGRRRRQAELRAAAGADDARRRRALRAAAPRTARRPRDHGGRVRGARLERRCEADRRVARLRVPRWPAAAARRERH